MNLRPSGYELIPDHINVHLRKLIPAISYIQINYLVDLRSLMPIIEQGAKLTPKVEIW